MADVEGTEAIDRAARILVGLVESDEYVSLAAIIERTGLSKSTAARLLRALERNGLAQRGPSGGFRPGRVLIEYARREASVADLAELAAPFLERLRRDTGETANIAIPLPGGVTRLNEFESAHPLGAGNWPGVRIPLHASAMGKVFMAFGAAQPPTGRLARLAPGTITSLPEVLRELERVRSDGYATTWEELEAGLCSVAAPVRGARGTVIAAISVSAPTVRTERPALDRLAVTLMAAADELSGLLGFAGPVRAAFERRSPAERLPANGPVRAHSPSARQPLPGDPAPGLPG
jgi:IclR family acetate operon transcriptional repressor